MPARLELPSLSGVSMSPRAWTLMESHELPQGAPELIKPRRTNPAVAHQFAAAQLQAAIGPPPSHRIPTPQPSRMMPPSAVGAADAAGSPPRRRGRPTQRAQVVMWPQPRRTARSSVMQISHTSLQGHGRGEWQGGVSERKCSSPRAAP